MFSRSVLRPAAQLRKNVRLYATEATSGGSKTPLIVGIGAVAVAAGAYYLYSGGEASSKAQSIVDKAKGEIKMSPTKTFTGGDQGFVDLKLREVFPVNHNTKKFRFDLPDKEEVSGLQIASALLTKFKAPDTDKDVMRPYTPISDESQPGYLDLLIKVYPNGPMSEHIHSLKPGDNLEFKGPLPKYPWETNKHTHIGLVAGGTGITPMYQLIRQIFQNPEDKTKVTLVFGNQTEEDILLRKEFDDLEKEFPGRFRTFYTVDKASEGWPHGKGVVTKELLETAIPGPKDENIKVFICGPAGFYKAISGAKKSVQDQGEVEGILKELGYTKEQVYKF